MAALPILPVAQSFYSLSDGKMPLELPLCYSFCSHARLLGKQVLKTDAASSFYYDCTCLQSYQTPQATVHKWIHMKIL